MTSAAEIIATLGLKPHPEGGWYAETFRDGAEGTRGHSTAIYFLLEEEQLSAWHRVRDAAEVWHFYAGAPLALSMHQEDGPVIVVPAGWWQSARSLGEWTLVGCTVAPGFDFAAFEMAEPGWEPPQG
ncbi:cupin domain-containing protein [Mesorhizobium helmanticense]|uniref:Cupin n=1 Tax=Mesorhizobium helmanticense TaxID=1776423 RepID=A0A2T4IT70_9HYPH|nr:cupin domain-containing protein [Mesorhizobium helmanticense]PTE08825.1 cupin [Mesorhizobium helmanticense]